MGKTRAEKMMEYHAILSMREEVEKDLLKIPGVLSVAVGIKLINKRVTEYLCFTVYVEKKKSPNELTGSDLIPSEIKGVKTDVQETAKNISLSAKKSIDEGKYRPMSGGIKIVPEKHKKHSGTLGCFALDDNADDDTDKVVMLSCYHVLMFYDQTPGVKVAQPSFCCDSCCCRCGEVAKVVRGEWHDKNVDCAIARLSNGNGNNWTNEVIELGAISCIQVNTNKDPINPATNQPGTADSPYYPFMPGDHVYKRGMATQLTEGYIHVLLPEIKFQVDLPDGSMEMRILHNQLEIYSISNDFFADLGDSGSVVLNESNQVIGLIWGSDISESPSIGYANPIWDVLKALHITIPDTGTLLTMPAKARPDTSGIPKKDAEDEVTEMIEQQKDGRLMMDIFKKHREEVMHLINTDREVKVAWNRHHGPSFAAHLMEKIRDRAYKIPIEIEGTSYQRLLSKISVVLEKKGSPEMTADIEKYSARALLLISNLIQSLNTMTA